MPEVDPVLVELAMSHYYHIKLYTDSGYDKKTNERLPNEKRTTTVKVFNRHKITYKDWQAVIREMAANPVKEERRKTPYKLLAEYFLGMDAANYADTVRKHELHKIIDALIMRTKAGLPYVSMNLRNLFFAGGSEVDGEEEAIYTMYKMAKKFRISPRDMTGGEVYMEDINGLLRMDEWETSIREEIGKAKQQLQQQQQGDMESKMAKFAEYLKGKQGVIDPLPPLGEKKKDDEQQQQQQPTREKQ